MKLKIISLMLFSATLLYLGIRFVLYAMNRFFTDNSISNLPFGDLVILLLVFVAALLLLSNKIWCKVIAGLVAGIALYHILYVGLVGTSAYRFELFSLQTLYHWWSESLVFQKHIIIEICIVLLITLISSVDIFNRISQKNRIL